MKKFVTIDLAILFILPVIASLLVFSFKLNYLSSILLFYGVPSLWLVLRNFKSAVRAFCFAVSISVPYSIILDTTGIVSNSWSVPHTAFRERFWNLIPYEDFLWLFFSMFMILCFYFSYTNKEAAKRDLFTKRFSVFLLLSLLVCFFFGVVDWEILKIPHAYFFWVSGLLFTPALIMLCLLKNRKSIVRASIPAAIYYFFTTILFETAGIALNHWNFPGQYILGKVAILGNLIPLEELLFVVLGGALGTIVFYHYLTEPPADAH